MGKRKAARRWRVGDEPMNAQKWMLAALLVIHFALAGAFSVIVPLGEAPDEADHWAYIVYLAENRRLPVGPSMTQSKHPPLYHATAAAVASLAAPANDFLHPNPGVQLEPSPDWSPNFFTHTQAEDWPWRDGVLSFHLVRLWSALLSTLAVAATYGLARAAFPAEPLLALTVAGVLAFLPEFAFIGGSVSNDNAAALFGALGLWGGLAIYQADGRLRPGWWTPFALGAGLLSKTSTAGLWPAIGLAIILGAARSGEMAPANLKQWFGACLRSWRRWLPTSALLFGLGLLMAAPWFLRNWRLYGDPLGLTLAMQTIDLRTSPWTRTETRWLLRGWFISSWGKFGGAGHIPMPSWIYLTLGVVSLASLGGLIVNLLPSRRRLALMPLLILVLAVLGVAVGMWRYSLTALGTDQGRLLYPAVGALVTLFVAGLLIWIPSRRQRTTAIMIVCLMALLALYALIGVVQPAFATSMTYR